MILLFLLLFVEDFFEPLRDLPEQLGLADPVVIVENNDLRAGDVVAAFSLPLWYILDPLHLHGLPSLQTKFALAYTFFLRVQFMDYFFPRTLR